MFLASMWMRLKNMFESKQKNEKNLMHWLTSAVDTQRNAADDDDGIDDDIVDGEDDDHVDDDMEKEETTDDEKQYKLIAQKNVIANELVPRDRLMILFSRE